MYTALIIQSILASYALLHRGTHGVTYWARVLENELCIAEATGVNIQVVTLFALFHDSRQQNEHTDHGHGLRGAEFAHGLRGSLIHLSDTEFDLLYEACRLHTSGLTEGDATLAGLLGCRPPRPAAGWDQACTPQAVHQCRP